MKHHASMSLAKNQLINLDKVRICSICKGTLSNLDAIRPTCTACGRRVTGKAYHIDEVMDSYSIMRYETVRDHLGVMFTEICAGRGPYGVIFTSRECKKRTLKLRWTKDGVGEAKVGLGLFNIISSGAPISRTEMYNLMMDYGDPDILG